MVSRPQAKGNRTLLGTDFLSSAGWVLDVKNTCWYFWDNPTHKYPFGEELDTPYIAEKMSSNTCQVREGVGEEATTVLEHHTFALTPYNNDRVKPLIPLRKRGRPPKVPQTPGSSSGRRQNQRGMM
ncbi:hypothetical protein TNCV_1338201 [Trichonephila clavipes]|nr:hypothetical protein TNCV_1338201 [Trichonephila clavipes]